MRLAGHGLRDRGAAYTAPDCRGCAVTHGPGESRRAIYWPREGHGSCRCGALSWHLDTNAERQEWHRQHKETIAAGTAKSVA